MGWSTVSKRVVFDKAVFVFFFFTNILQRLLYNERA